MLVNYGQLSDDPIWIKMSLQHYFSSQDMNPHRPARPSSESKGCIPAGSQWCGTRSQSQHCCWHPLVQKSHSRVKLGAPSTQIHPRQTAAADQLVTTDCWEDLDMMTSLHRPKPTLLTFPNQVVSNQVTIVTMNHHKPLNSVNHRRSCHPVLLIIGSNSLSIIKQQQSYPKFLHYRHPLTITIR